MMSDTFSCPHCGAMIPLDSKSCLGCGSDDRTGWSPNTMYDGLDLPGWDDVKRDLGFRDTLLWHDLKIMIGVLSFLSFLFLSIRIYSW
jgi:hypothetical protein